MNPVKRFTSWLDKNLSADPATSNSRTLQTLIVINAIAMLWVVLAVSHWVIAPTTQVVLVTLITSGAGAYVGGKFGERS